MRNDNIESTLENVCNKRKKTKTINVEIVTFLGGNGKRNMKRKEENKCITKKNSSGEANVLVFVKHWYT